MHLEEIHQYCLEKPGTEEDFPFGDDVLAFKVAGKIFALVNLEKFPQFINLKCDPERAVELRVQYDAVRPGYHMNKRHWNSVYLDGAYTRRELLDWIDHSYDLVVQGLSKKDREGL